MRTFDRSKSDVGYGRVRPGRSFAVQHKPKKIVNGKKKTSAVVNQFRSQILNLTEKVIFSACGPTVNDHRSCAKVVIDDDGSIPRVCVCDCHTSKAKRRSSPTIELRAKGVSVAAVKHVFVKRAKAAELAPVVIHNTTKEVDLRPLYAAHATALKVGSDVLNSRGNVELPRYLRLGGRRVSMRITAVWSETRV